MYGNTYEIYLCYYIYIYLTVCLNFYQTYTVKETSVIRFSRMRETLSFTYRYLSRHKTIRVKTGARNNAHSAAFERKRKCQLSTIPGKMIAHLRYR